MKALEDFIFFLGMTASKTALEKMASGK